jgi:uncharacterized protein with von Willebrand factor type A (vWA) domain
MSEIINKILKELDELEAVTDKLHENLGGAKTQTDLEVAILSRHLADANAKNVRATQLIDKSIAQLKGLK